MSLTTTPTRKISIQAAAVFLFTLGLCFLLVFVMVSNRIQVERLTMEQLISEKSVRITDGMSRLLIRGYTLSSYVVHNDGQFKDFPRLAAMLIDDPAILNLLIAPGGVVTEVYPLKGNEAVIGLDFFSGGVGSKEAIMAKETRQLVLGGPFESVHGEQVMVGRLPVFMDGPDGAEYFWGIVSVTLAYPQALQTVRLGGLAIMGFDYEIWRINPDNDEMQLIAGSEHGYRANERYIEIPVSILNAKWYFRIFPVRAWYEFPETWVSIFTGIFVSLMTAVVVQRNRDLKILKDRLAVLSNTDPLTCIHNRRHFMESVAIQMDRVIRHGSESFVMILDLDHFKAVNDKYGHQSGDIVLKEVSARVASALRPYDLFARYGGEEFILFVADMDREFAMRLAERIRLGISEMRIKVTGANVAVTASLGIALAAPAHTLENAIAYADKALYQAKNQGRNRVVFYDAILK